VLDSKPAHGARVFWRKMGTGRFQEMALTHSGGGVYEGTLGVAALGKDDVEYYVEVAAASGETLRWPVTAPKVSQTVVRMPW